MDVDPEELRSTPDPDGDAARIAEDELKAWAARRSTPAAQREAPSAPRSSRATFALAALLLALAGSWLVLRGRGQSTQIELEPNAPPPRPIEPGGPAPVTVVLPKPQPIPPAPVASAPTETPLEREARITAAALRSRAEREDEARREREARAAALQAQAPAQPAPTPKPTPAAARFPDDYSRAWPATLRLAPEGHAEPAGPNWVIGTQALAKLNAKDLESIQISSHVIYLQFLQAGGDDFAISYSTAAQAWTVARAEPGRLLIRAENGREGRFVLQSGWNELAFRVQVMDVATRERQLEIRLNSTLLPTALRALPFNGTLQEFKAHAGKDTKLVVGGLRIVVSR